MRLISSWTFGQRAEGSDEKIERASALATIHEPRRISLASCPRAQPA
jgi:hypothetical protein